VLLLVLIVAMLLGVLGPKLFAPSQWEHRFKVGLGLDLSSGTQVTLRAQTLTGKAPSTEEMNAAVGVIESRVNGTGNSGAQVQPQGANLLVVTVPGKGSQQTIELVSSTALLMFRQVLLYEPYGATRHAGSRGECERLAQRHAVGVREPLGNGDPVRQFHQYGEDLGQDPPGGQCQRLAQRVRGRHRVTERLGQRQSLGQCQSQRQPEFARDWRRGRQPEPRAQGRAREVQQAGLQAG
jgi:preprotein translocase subunit SecD